MKKNKILKLFLLISFILAVAIIIAINFKMNTVLQSTNLPIF